MACLQAPAVWAGDPEKARELFQQGSVYFDSGQFGKAIEVWQRGYEEKQDPGFLYNMAQAYRLSGDPRKAVFFYKSFLRNSPKTSQRQEVEEKLATLQKQIAAEDRAAAERPGPPAAPVAPETPPVVIAPTDATGGVSPPPPATGLELPPPPLPPADPGPLVREAARDVDPFDLGVAAGASVWLSGPADGSRTSFAVAGRVGYTFGEADRDARVHFRLGAHVQFASLRDTAATDSFTDLLLEPSVRVGLVRERLFLNGGVGAGLLVLGGLTSSSLFLSQDWIYKVSGSQALFEVRPALSLTYRLFPAVELTAGGALAINPRKENFHAALARLELSGGAALRF
jgi:hypothetical protein